MEIKNFTSGKSKNYTLYLLKNKIYFDCTTLSFKTDIFRPIILSSIAFSFNKTVLVFDLRNIHQRISVSDFKSEFAKTAYNFQLH